MGKRTGIQWTGASWNPWQGCTKVSPGCKHCYMYGEKARYGQNPAVCVRSKPPTFNLPLKWEGPTLIFTCSWSDWFINTADPWRDEAWEIIRRTPHHTYQILTKRPERIGDHLPSGWPFPNVWLGVSVENQAAADSRIPELLASPAVLRFLSVEPLLGGVDLGKYLATENTETAEKRRIDWVIVGGESGPGARPMHPEWARGVRDQCVAAGVPYFFKQWGNWEPDDGRLYSETIAKTAIWMSRDGVARSDIEPSEDTDDQVMFRVGKKAAGRMLDGRTWDEMPLTANYNHGGTETQRTAEVST